MAEMSAAVRAHDLGADHPEGHVAVLVDRVPARRRVERRPAAAGVVFRLGLEELGAAAGAAVRAVLEDVVVLARERPLCSLLPQDAVLVRAELQAPFLLGLLNFRHHAPSIAVSSSVASGASITRSSDPAPPPPRRWPHWRRQRSRRSEEHTSELQSHVNLVCRLLLEKKKKKRVDVRIVIKKNNKTKNVHDSC